MSRLRIAPTAHMANTVFNLTSGSIEIGDKAFAGHNVLFITGTHQTDGDPEHRWADFPLNGHDIRVGRGVWIGSSAIILGPCLIGDGAVIGASSLVLAGSVIPPYEVWAGVPAHRIRSIARQPSTPTPG